MLNPSYLLHATEPAEEIAEQLHQDILNRIIRRIMTRFRRGDEYILTATDRWQIQTLQEAGMLLDDIQKVITASTPYMQEEIAQAMEDAGIKALSYDDRIYREAGLDPKPLTQSPSLVNIMQRDYLATLGDWKNFTRTTAEAAQQTYIRLCDRAYHQAMSGALSPEEAVRDALEELISKGAYVEFPSGRRDTIETATARAVRTGISQATGHIQVARMDEMDVDLVLVSSHLGARPEHEVWQGQVYSRSGLNPKYPHFETVTGYGKVDGLCGANCRHSFGPYFEGQSNPFKDYDDEENRKRYELEQRQRTLETRIRNTKRQMLGWKEAGDEEMYQRKAALLKRQNAAYNEFCEKNGLKKRSERLRIAQWDRAQAAQARAAAKRHQRTLEIQKIEAYNKKKEEVSNLIKSDAIPKKINRGNQQKHIRESKGYIAGKSYIYGDLETTQNLVDLHHGTGEPVFDRKGKWRNKEIILSGKVIGVNVSSDTGMETETRRFVIHYGKKGTHVVPTKELEE